jgi:hypothetical protein
MLQVSIRSVNLVAPLAVLLSFLIYASPTFWLPQVSVG